MKPTIDEIREVRVRTGLGLHEVVKAFEHVQKVEDVYSVLTERGVEIMERRQVRDTKVCVCHAYVHHNGKFGSLVEFKCETDFVAQSESFKQFMDDICMHVAVTPIPYLSDGGIDRPAFLAQLFVKDPARYVGALLSEITARTGEKVEIGEMSRYQA